MKTANVLMIDRLRMGTDGDGVTTLVGFYGCPLRCKYCINDRCHTSESDSVMTSADLYNRVKIDQLYFKATGGGLTFGGGEPLLNAEFIFEIMELGAKEWHTTIETSLNVPYKQINSLLPYINELIVDIKDINPLIYKSYTLSENDNVLNNLSHLAHYGCANKVLIRIPLIKGYNTNRDIENSKNFLTNLGYSNFDIFEYKTDFRYDGKRKM